MSKALCCSFCGKDQDRVKKLIAGPGVYICNECVELCLEIMDEEKGSRHQGNFHYTYIDTAELKETKEVKDKELETLIFNAITPLEKLVDHYAKSKFNPYFEPGIRTLLYLKMQTGGRHSPDMPPLLESLANHYTNQGHYKAAADVIDWTIEIMEEFNDENIHDKQAKIFELVRAYIRSGDSARAEKWLAKLESKD